jgi:hypothetical protein
LSSQSEVIILTSFMWYFLIIRHISNFEHTTTPRQFYRARGENPGKTKSNRKFNMKRLKELVIDSRMTITLSTMSICEGMCHCSPSSYPVPPPPSETTPVPHTQFKSLSWQSRALSALL